MFAVLKKCFQKTLYLQCCSFSQFSPFAQSALPPWLPTSPSLSSPHLLGDFPNVLLVPASLYHTKPYHITPYHTIYYHTNSYQVLPYHLQLPPLHTSFATSPNVISRRSLLHFKLRVDLVNASFSKYSQSKLSQKLWQSHIS